MGPFLIRAALTGFALWVVTKFVHGLTFVGGDTTLQRVGIIFVVAVIFGLVNAFIKPIVQFLSIPLYIVTLGLFHVVVNALDAVVHRPNHRTHHSLGTADRSLLVDRDLGRDRAVDRQLAAVAGKPRPPTRHPAVAVSASSHRGVASRRKRVAPP